MTLPFDWRYDRHRDRDAELLRLRRRVAELERENEWLRRAAHDLAGPPPERAEQARYTDH